MFFKWSWSDVQAKRDNKYLCFDNDIVIGLAPGEFLRSFNIPTVDGMCKIAERNLSRRKGMHDVRNVIQPIY